MSHGVIRRDDVPTPKVYPRLNRRLRLVMWLAALGGIVVLGIGIHQYLQQMRLKSEGQTTAGRLVDSSTLATGRGGISYRLVLDYTPKDSARTYRKQFVVSQSAYDRARDAGDAPVTYLPSDPTLSAVGDNVTADTEPLAMGVGLLIVAGAIAFYRRRQNRILDEYLSPPATDDGSRTG